MHARLVTVCLSLMELSCPLVPAYHVTPARRRLERPDFSPNRCTRQRYEAVEIPFILYFWLPSKYSRGDCRTGGSQWFDLSRRAGFLILQSSTQQGGRCHRAIRYLCEDGVIILV